MKFKVTILFITLSIALFGCRTKKVSSHVSVTVKDSVSTVIERSELFDSIVLSPKIQIEYVVLNPCDSLGNLKQIDQVVQVGKARNRVFTQVNRHTGAQELIVQSSCDSVVQRYQKMISDKSTELRLSKSHIQTKEVKVARQRNYLWWFVGSVVYGLFITILLVRVVLIKIN